MQKRILIIGNDSGLPGVKVDISNYKTFFQSAIGGNWEDEEIEVLLNPRKVSLQLKLMILSASALDYLIIIFSGHGGQERETVLEINSKGELIGDSDLKGIAKRQLNIYDCCRCISEKVNETKQLLALIKSFSVVNTREKYEKRILEAVPQQVSLYSCSIGEISNDTSNGGLYSTHLINSAQSFSDEFKLIGTAHSDAYNLVIQENKLFPPERQQHPEAVLPRCLSSQQLIIGVNPVIR